MSETVNPQRVEDPELAHTMANAAKPFMDESVKFKKLEAVANQAGDQNTAQTLSLNAEARQAVADTVAEGIQEGKLAPDAEKKEEMLTHELGKRGVGSIWAAPAKKEPMTPVDPPARAKAKVKVNVRAGYMGQGQPRVKVQEKTRVDLATKAKNLPKKIKRLR